MKHRDSQNSELLDELLTDAERESAPSIDKVLNDVRREKHGRSNRRILAGTIAMMVLLGIVLLREPSVELQPVVAVAIQTSSIPAQSVVVQSVVEPGPTPERATSTEPAEWKVDRIDDQELLDLLQEMPVALVKYPDGNRRLMMVVDNGGQ